ncbi:DeoR/GlpR family DNA-binding transcription regulator [Ovoidimarina sediminis]|uniref:DeoR/GlpR family DNA-binding transcription regulator n=1 Tax=Ovoidimarina sediminis TaxID=3079856 RepID=UPI0029129CDD|nr:DeoR/GlpR family DNA-binding transcription regulator [Rhodophyticola sp. MJ-SS7]MDU8944165.1 DeoR/GlpR family DNA-binding transcription regulator [Rhodophyticola sp. MJ-SS7]
MTESFRLGAARRRKIVDLVEGRGSVAVTELSQELGVSEATIRRDLRELGETGAVTRTHGGVVNNASVFVDLPNDERMLVGAEEKRRIGRAAIELLSGDEIVFLDAGTTAQAVAENAHRRPGCRYITSCLRIASLLRDQGIRNFYLVGGAYIGVNDSFGGRLAISAIRTLSFDISFLCCSSIDLDHRSISISDEGYSQIQAEVVAASRRNMVVAHHAKFGAAGFIRTASFDSIECVITDDGADGESRRRLERAGVSLVIA